MAGAIIPDDWDGISYTTRKLLWPDSGMWLEILRGQLSEPAAAPFWDADTGDENEASQVAITLIDLNFVSGFYPALLQPEVSMLVGQVIWVCTPYMGGDNKFIPCSNIVIDFDCPLRDLLIAAGYPFGGGGDTPWGPGLAERFVLGDGDIDGTNVGELGGTETETLTVAQMPTHSHNVWNQNAGAAATIFAVAGGDGTDDYILKTTTSSGSSAPHNNMPPYVKLLPLVYTGL